MRIVLYGMPCSGKTYLLNKLKNIEYIEGSKLLNEISNNKFEKLCEEDKRKKRIELLNILKEKENIIIDGHYKFEDNVVFTEEDSKFYDFYLYLYCEENILKERIIKSSKNNKYKNSNLKKWQSEEINELREYCHKNNKCFIVIDNIKYFNEFLEEITKNNNYNSYNYAKKIVKEILKKGYKYVNLIDGDKTLINVDTSRYFLNYKTNVFDNNFYTAFQNYLSYKELDYDKKINEKLFEDIKYNKSLLELKNKIIISSGLSYIWEKIGKIKNIDVYSGEYINSETKFFIAKLLKEKINTIAYGDSAIDYYMLKEANKSCLIYNGKISKSLKDKNIEKFKKDFFNHIIFVSEIKDLKKLISITKSNSNINGGKLAKAHIELGYEIGNILSEIYSEYSVISIGRGGSFLATGIYSSFNNCTFSLTEDPIYDYENNSNKTLEKNKIKNNIILVDSVINTGNSIYKYAKYFSDKNKNVIIATNVIQEDAIFKLKEFNLIAIRSSKNKFIGERIKSQQGNKGPDTGDRLYGLI